MYSHIWLLTSEGPFASLFFFAPGVPGVSPGLPPGLPPGVSLCWLGVEAILQKHMWIYDQVIHYMET